jgi:hypothetical protein
MEKLKSSENERKWWKLALIGALALAVGTVIGNTFSEEY